MKCVFDYMYRDASNYKQFESVLLLGECVPAAVEAIERCLDQDGLFIPEFVGLQRLQDRGVNFPSEDDHIWHEYICLRTADDTDLRELGEWGTLVKLVENFQVLPKWGSAAMIRRIGLLLEQEPYSLMI